MLKKLLWPVLIGAMLATVLLILFPTLRDGKDSFISNRLFYNQPISYYPAVKAAAPAVVNIYSRSIQRTPEKQNNNVVPLGSGVIVTKEGYIVTNLHVIQNAEQIIVALQDGRIFDSTIVGSDQLVDIAVLKIDDNNLPVIPINLAREPHVGDVVLAIGNPYNIGQTITQGIISATGRDGLSPYRRQNFIQTDASINHGNSGGALVNSLGELIGINTLSFNKNLGVEIPEGLSFAIPTALVIKIMDKLIKDGRIIRGYLGVDGFEFAPSQNPNKPSRTIGILVTNVEGPAEKAGIKRNDILISVNNIAVVSILETMDMIAELKPGETVPIIVLRNGENIELQIMVGQHPN